MEIVHEERIEHDREQILAQQLGGLKKGTFVILKNQTSAPVRQERMSLLSKARSEANRSKLVEKR